MGFWNSITRIFTSKSNTKKSIEEKSPQINPKFNRTEREEELAFNFYQRHYETINSLENSVYEETNKVFNIYSIDKRIEQCKKAINAYEKLKKFCYSKGKGGQIYFDDMWEHCHNSKNPDFRYIERVEKELEYITNNYSEAFEKLNKEKLKHERKEHIRDFKQKAEKDLLNFIKEHEGILQKDLYKHFDNEYKSIISSTLKKLHAVNKIERIKDGNSYQLFLNKSRKEDNE